ncbi:MAG: tRNA (adenosine(37)-N6)-dimethylallyltransferase MiaA [Patescibacteria group bacterium]
MPKILVILGQTATGKSDLAVQLAQKFNGEVISADSRQVYIGLDIGTGKITKKEMFGVRHHLLDVVSPKKVFSVAEWREQADTAIRDILSRGKLPIICGGTGFYIQSIVDNVVLPEVPPNTLLRRNLGGKSVVELFKMLEKIDPERARTVDAHNPVRLIRALEIAKTLGTVPKLRKQKNSYNILQIGLTQPDEELKKRIRDRLLARMKVGMAKESKKLHDSGLSWKRMQELGLEYRYLAQLAQNKISKTEFFQHLESEIWSYARRQMTWFKRDKNINWYNPSEKEKIEKTVAKWFNLN